MPYITTSEVAEKRAAIKKAFPTWKFSISRKHYSTLSVIIISADLDLLPEGEKYSQINPYHIKNHYTGAIAEALTAINDLAANGVRTLVNDGDYGNVPTFYVDISIGNWDKPFIYSPSKP